MFVIVVSHAQSSVFITEDCNSVNVAVLVFLLMTSASVSPLTQTLFWRTASSGQILSCFSCPNHFNDGSLSAQRYIKFYGLPSTD